MRKNGDLVVVYGVWGTLKHFDNETARIISTFHTFDIGRTHFILQTRHVKLQHLLVKITVQGKNCVKSDCHSFALLFAVKLF